VGGYTRTYQSQSGSNQFVSTTVGNNVYGFDYDAQGNITLMPQTLEGLVWDGLNRLSCITLQTGTDPGKVFYGYDGQGNRNRKSNFSQGSTLALTWDKTYLAVVEIYRKYTSGTMDKEQFTFELGVGFGPGLLVEGETGITNKWPMQGGNNQRIGFDRLNCGVQQLPAKGFVAAVE